MTDHSPYANGYAWAVQAMVGLTPNKIIHYTKKAYQEGNALIDQKNLMNETKINVPSEGTSFRVPFFYPQMVLQQYSLR